LAAIAIAMGIAIRDGHLLDINPLNITCALDLPGKDINSHQIDLGTDVDITQLTLQAGTLHCQGRIQVNP
jgi:hypothetical protein